MLVERFVRPDTTLAYLPAGPVIVEEADPAAAWQAREQVRLWTAHCPPQSLAGWRSAYISWLRKPE